MEAVKNISKILKKAREWENQERLEKNTLGQVVAWNFGAVKKRT